MRAWLIVPPDAGEPDTTGADALILTHPCCPDWLAGVRARIRVPLYVRVAPGAPDLDAAMALGPDGILLPRVASGADLARLGARLAVHEAEAGLRDGATRILAGLGTAAGLLHLRTLPGASPRLAGLCWEAADLAAALGLDASSADGAWPAPFAQGRGLVVLAAAAACVPAIDEPCPGGDGAAVERAACAARRDGFRGSLARDAASAAILARVFAEP